MRYLWCVLYLGTMPLWAPVADAVSAAWRKIMAHWSLSPCRVIGHDWTVSHVWMEGRGWLYHAHVCRRCFREEQWNP